MSADRGMGGGIGQDGEPMYTLTTCFEPAVCLWEETEIDKHNRSIPEINKTESSR